VKNGVAYFDGYTYTLTAECSYPIVDEQICEDGGTRTCSRCAGVHLQPHAAWRSWSRGGGRSIQRNPPPVHDCTQPCPADEWTLRLQPLNRVLEGRVFYAPDPREGVLFLRGKDCRNAARRERTRRSSASSSG
jgi:hypothetical protein